MGLRFRKSIKAGPLRVNFSKSGIGYSVGTMGLRYTKKAGGGTRTTASIPGTGLSYTRDNSGKKQKSKKQSNRDLASKPVTTTSVPTISHTSNYQKEPQIYTITLKELILVWLLGWLGAHKFYRKKYGLGILYAVSLGLFFIGWIGDAASLTIRYIAHAKGKNVSVWQNCVAYVVPFVFLFLLQKIQVLSTVWAALIADALYVGINYLAYRELGGQKSTVKSPIQIQSASLSEQLQEPLQAEFTSLDEPQREHYIFEQFESELQAIPRVDIPLSDPVPRHLLKDLPPYTFSNITRTTQLDSIFPLVFLDTETTGLYPSKSEIVEVSAIKFNQGMVPVSCFTTFCKPRKPIPEEATAINHITDDMVADAPEFRQIAQALTEFLQGCNIAGHNLDFDLRFVFAHGADLPTGKRFYDTLDLAHLTVSKGDIRNYKLDTLCSYYGIWRKQAHRSLSDCYATSKVFTNLVFDKTSRQLKAALDTE